MSKNNLEKKLKDAAAFLKKNKTAAIAAGITTIALAPVSAAISAGALATGAVACVAATAKKGAAKRTRKGTRKDRKASNAAVNFESIKDSVCDAASKIGDNVVDAKDAVVKKWNNLDKGTKVGAAVVAGGAVAITVPFLVAAGAGVSIVSALAILGGGTLAAGGFGVMGGIIVTAGGATIAGAIAGVVTSKFADDPELVAMSKQYAALEKRVKVQFAAMERIMKKDFRAGSMSDDERVMLRTNCKHAYACYGRAAEKAAGLLKKLEKGSGKYNSEDVRKTLAMIEVASDELKEVRGQLRDYGLI